MSAVKIDCITKNFTAFKAVDNLSLSIEAGEFVTLLGPSGCGKTTTLRMVAGLEQNDDGSISIGHEAVSDAARGFFLPPERRSLGMVFQSYAIWPHMTVLENVAYPLKVRRLSAKEMELRARAALRLVEMEDFAERPAPALSGGQQQRVAIARALVFEPAVMLLDEPLSNLDAKLRAQMGDEFRKLQRRLGVTTLYVTHDQDEAMALSDRVVVMHKGRILQMGPPEQIYQRPESLRVARFFGSPNLFTARITETLRDGEDGLLVRVEGPGITGLTVAQRGLEPGREITVMVRPENLSPFKPSDDADERLSWHGTVAHAVFRGSRRSVVVDTPQGPVNVEIPALIRVTQGEEITLYARPEGAWAFDPQPEEAN